MGPVFALARIPENIFEELFLKYVFAPSQTCFAPSPPPSVWVQWLYHPWRQYIKIFLGNLFRCKYMRRMYSHAGEYRKIFLSNSLCIGFVPGGMRASAPLLEPCSAKCCSVKTVCSLRCVCLVRPSSMPFFLRRFLRRLLQVSPIRTGIHSGHQVWRLLSFIPCVQHRQNS